MALRIGLRFTWLCEEAPSRKRKLFSPRCSGRLRPTSVIKDRVASPRLSTMTLTGEAQQSAPEGAVAGVRIGRGQISEASPRRDR